MRSILKGLKRMSSTRRRKSNSQSNANYPTPRWCIERFLEEHIDKFDAGDNWIEPAAGDGTIIDMVNRYRDGIVWTAIDIRDTTPALQSIGLSLEEIHIGDFFKLLHSDLRARRWDVAILNPPFHLTLDFVMRCRGIAQYVVIFQSLNFLGSEERNKWIQSDVPDIYVIPDRVSHTGDGKTDSVYSAWQVWGPRPQAGGELYVLPCTPLEERRREQARIKRLRDEKAITLDSMFDRI